MASSDKQENKDSDNTENDQVDKNKDNELEPGNDNNSRTKVYVIKIDRNEYSIPEKNLSRGTLTGAQIRELPDPPIPQERDLFQVIPGGPDRKLEDDEKVEIRDGLRLFTAPTNIHPGRKLK